MFMESWKYYNHAVISNLPPHIAVELSPIQDGTIWNITSKDGKKPLLVCYHTDYDTKEETTFWYIIRDNPLSMDEFSKKRKKIILKSLERSEVKRIDPIVYADSIYAVYKAAFQSYESADNEVSEEQFKKNLNDTPLEYWGAFSKETGELAGWMSCYNHGDWTETVSAKYHPGYLTSVRPSEGIHYHILMHYLNELGQKYICSGSRNINHKTHVQDYKIRNWNFRRAYCKLHIVYNPKIKWIVKCLYPIRKILLFFDREIHIHQVNSLLRMEEIARSNMRSL